MNPKLIITLLLLFLNKSLLFAQESRGLLDGKIRYGKLENGMTYYILQNKEPKERASFYMVHNVGAILEEDHQDGLAHMLEHMAFNGSTHFPGKGIQHFLERNGVEFGRNINAYTNVDETVYNISNVPTEKKEVMDSCVWVLHDWSGSIALEAGEIDAERGVIKEEWRTRNNADRRIYRKLAPTMFYQSKYAERDVIGDMDVVENSDYEAIRSFYSKWYRPDLQAAVIVGDFDVDAMEVRVKDILSRIPKAQNPAERIEYTIAENEGVLFAVATDKEATKVRFSYVFKHPAVERSAKDMAYLKTKLNRQMISSMMSNRFQEILQKPGAPFLNAYVQYYNAQRTMDAFAIGGVAKEESVLESIEAVLTEVERAKRHGFLSSELDRVKADLLKSYESWYKTREKISNDKHAMQIKNHFLESEPQLSPELRYGLANEYIPTVTVEDLNGYLKDWMTEDNAYLTISGPDKESIQYPADQEAVGLLGQVEHQELTAYEDTAAGQDLLEEIPTPGKTVNISPLPGMENGQIYTLSNGVKALLYPTDHKKSEIIFTATSYGGESLLKQEELPTAFHFRGLAGFSGIGNHSRSELQRLLTGKNASVSPSVSGFTEGVGGRADKDDIETMMQLLYLTFTQPRFDEEAFEVYMERVRPSYKNLEKNPRKVFGDTIAVVLNNGSERKMLNNRQILDKMSFDAFRSIYESRFSDPADFIFTFVGDFEEKEMLPLLETYLGSIPSNGLKEKWEDHGIRPPSEGVTKHFSHDIDPPKHSHFFRYHTDRYEYNAFNNLCVDMAASLLKKRYFDTMREEEGGTYGASVNGFSSLIPEPAAGIMVSFDGDPEKSEKLVQIVKNEMDKLLSEGADPGDFDKVKEALLKERGPALENNGYLLGRLQAYHLTGINSLLPENYEDIVNSLSVEDFNAAISSLLAPESLKLYEVVMKPSAE